MRHGPTNSRSDGQLKMLVVAMTASLTGVAATAAADTEREKDVLAEVVVTASLTGEQDLQSVPMAIAALGAGELAAANVQGLGDYARLVPTISLQEQGPGVSKIDMRGLTTGRSTPVNPQDRALVSIYLDDVPISLAGFNPDLNVFDLQRVEVVRGPQGTLYGAGSMSGAIRLVTVKPTAEGFSGSAEASYGQTEGASDGNYSVRGLVNVPLGEALAMRVAGYRGRLGGWIDNVGTGQRDANGSVSTQGRVAVRYAPSDRFAVDLSSIYSDLDVDDWGVTYASLGGRQANSLHPESFADRTRIHNLSATASFAGVELVSSTSFLDRDFSLVRTGEWLMTRRFLVGQRIASPNNVDNSVRTFAEELRLRSTGDGAWSWIVGAFWQKDDRNWQIANPTPGFDALMRVRLGRPGFSSLNFAAPAPDMVFFGTQAMNQRQLALFGEATLRVSERVSVTGGLRYFDWKQDFDLFYAGFLGALGPGTPLTRRDKATADGTNPRVVVSFQSTDDTLIYAQAAKGFRYGGVNEPVPLAFCAQDLAAIGLREAPATFGPDQLWSYEAGAKTRLGSGTRLNGALFLIDWKDVQNRTQLPCTYTFLVNNGNVRSRGVELESSTAVSDRWNVSGGVSFTDARARGPISQLNARDGDRVPYFPRWIVNLSSDWSKPLATSKNLRFRVDYQHRAKTFSSFNPSAIDYVELPASDMVNAQLSLETAAWDLMLYARNLTDERQVTQVIPNAGGPRPSDEFFYARPRTFGVSARVRF